MISICNHISSCVGISGQDCLFCHLPVARTDEALGRSHREDFGVLGSNLPHDSLRQKEEGSRTWPEEMPGAQLYILSASVNDI